jgi:bacterioferritin-associated ferredoxin
MYVCICAAVTDDDLHTAVSQGASSVDHISASTGAGSSCGTCVDCLHEFISAAHAGGSDAILVR